MIGFTRGVEAKMKRAHMIARAEVPVLPMLPKEIVNDICRRFYATAELLSDCLQMSLVCVSFRRHLEKLLQEERRDFLKALGQRCMNAFKKCLDFRYVRERQCITAFEMSYALREMLVSILEKTVMDGDLHLIAREGYVKIKSHGIHELFKELGYSNDEIYGMAIDDEDLSDDTILPIVSKALCNVDAFLGQWLHLKLVFRRKDYSERTCTITQHPFKELTPDSQILFASTHTQMFHNDDGNELSFICQ